MLTANIKPFAISKLKSDACCYQKSTLPQEKLLTQELCLTAFYFLSQYLIDIFCSSKLLMWSGLLVKSKSGMICICLLKVTFLNLLTGSVGSNLSCHLHLHSAPKSMAGTFMYSKVPKCFFSTRGLKLWKEINGCIIQKEIEYNLHYS